MSSSPRSVVGNSCCAVVHDGTHLGLSTALTHATLLNVGVEAMQKSSGPTQPGDLPYSDDTETRYPETADALRGIQGHVACPRPYPCGCGLATQVKFDTPVGCCQLWPERTDFSDISQSIGRRTASGKIGTVAAMLQQQSNAADRARVAPWLP